MSRDSRSLMRVALLIVGAFLFFGTMWCILDMLGPTTFGRPGRPVRKTAWARMEVRMDTNDVKRLLGEPETVVASPVNPPGLYWEYGWVSPSKDAETGPPPEDNAYVVFFDTNEVVVEWRAPIADSE